MNMTNNNYTNIFQWGEANLGKTLDNEYKALWEIAGKLILSIHNMNIEIWECDNCLITIRTYASGCFKLLDIQ